MLYVQWQTTNNLGLKMSNISNFREILLRRAENNVELQALIKSASDDFIEGKMIEALEKMAEDRRRPRSTNKAVQHFGDYSLDSAGDMANMIHDALSHHVSHYKAALKNNNKTLASQHMKKIHNIMHFSRKLSRDSANDYSGGKLNIEAVDPKPWERSGFPATSEGKVKKFVTDTKGWSRDGGTYDYMQMEPHSHYSKETDMHGHKGAYPLEEIKVNGKYLDINDDIKPTSYVGHEFDEHPIIKNDLYKKPPQDVDEKTYDKYLKDLEEYESSPHMDSYFDRHEKLQSADPDKYAKRGSFKPEKAIVNTIKGAPSNAPSITKPSTVSPESMALHDEVHNSLTDDQKNHPAVKALLNSVKHGLSLDKDTIVNMARGITSSSVKKNLILIGELLKKNKEFLIENPDILINLRDRLNKAISRDEADRWLMENDPQYSDGQYEDEGGYTEGDPSYDDEENRDYENADVEGLFDKPEEQDTYSNKYDDEDKELVDAEVPQYVDVNSDDDGTTSDTAASSWQHTPQRQADEEVKEVPDKKSMYSDWKPRDDYTKEQQSKIASMIEEGYHPRDAEILAGAHKRFGNMRDAINSRVNPHEMSAKMHERLKGIANDYVDNLVAGQYKHAEPEVNPQKATAATVKSYNDLMEDFRQGKEDFYNREDVKKMKPRDRHAAFKQWKDKFHADNPDFKENIGQEWIKHGETDKENKQKRKEYLEEGKKAIAQAGFMDVEPGGSISSGSKQMAMGPGGEEHAQTIGGAYQSAGIASEDEGSPAAGTTIKDPYSSFAERNPSLKDKYMKQLKSSLSSDAMARMQRVNTLKGK